MSEEIVISAIDTQNNIGTRDIQIHIDTPNITIEDIIEGDEYTTIVSSLSDDIDE
jgi:hypothetical protein